MPVAFGGCLGTSGDRLLSIGIVPTVDPDTAVQQNTPLASYLEETDPTTVEAVASSGATRFQAVPHWMVPQTTSIVATDTLYRWECTIRSATVLGFVGAGGIGY